jgi:hypothetical protein
VLSNSCHRLLAMSSESCASCCRNEPFPPSSLQRCPACTSIVDPEVKTTN